MRHWRWYSKLLFALVVAAFAYFVWPTPWRHFTAYMGDMTLTYREHRITGETQLFYRGEWQD